LQESKDLCLQTGHLVEEQALRIQHFYQQKVQEIGHVFMAIETELSSFRDELLQGLKFALEQATKSG
jgi:hypothetical protein